MMGFFFMSGSGYLGLGVEKRHAFVVVLLLLFLLSTAVPANSELTGRKETAHFTFYYGTTQEDFVDQYSGIAENGYPGLEGIFGTLSQKIEVYLCETVDEFKAASSGLTPPNFDGTAAAGQVVDGKVQIYKPAEFKPGGSYAAGLLHEIGHAAYFQLYPNALRKNNWLNEALADKSVTGTKIGVIGFSELKIALERGTFIPLVDLEEHSARTPETENGINFSEYSSFVNFLAGEFGFDALRSMLDHYDSCENLVASLEKSTGVSASVFENKWMEKIMGPPTEGVRGIYGWVSKTDLGPQTTVFMASDGIHPVLQNDTDGQPVVGVRLVDPGGKILVERTAACAPMGRTGCGDLNPGGALIPGTYTVEFWSGDVLINSIQISVSGTTTPERPPEVPTGQELPVPILLAIAAIVLVAILAARALRKKK